MADTLEDYINKRAGIETKPAPKSIDSDISADLDSYLNKRVETAQKTARGAGRAIAQGLTLGFSDELEAALSDGKYKDTIKEVRQEMAEFSEKNPGTAFSLELLGAIPTSFAGSLGLTRAGVKSFAKQGAVEGAVYGAGTGDEFEDRLITSASGALAGLTLGKAISLATTPRKSGGLKTESNELADASLDKKTDAQRAEDLKEELWEERNIPDYDRIPLREAATVGEFYNSAVTGLKKFYDDKITGASDAITRYMPQVGMRFQRADENALRIVNQELDDMAEELLPIAKVINEDERVKGIFLDFAAGRITNNVKKVGGVNMQLADSLDESISVLFNMIKNDFSQEQLGHLKRYLRYSHEKNKDLNGTIFGIRPEMFPAKVYMHTRNRFIAKKIKEEEDLTDAQVEKRMFNDAGMSYRSRATYTRDGKNQPSKPGEERLNPNDYDNPLISDMQRLFQLEKLNQLQRVYGVDIKPEIALKKKRLIIEAQQAGLSPEQIKKIANKDVYLTPDEFMDALEMSLYSKGISSEGAGYAVNKMTETIMGSQKSPHPMIQAMNSFAYATTLAGPMSAFLNLADIPLLGAKYGKAAVFEGLNELNPFKKIPSIDLKKAGLDNQVMGEFTNKLNDQMQEGAEGFIQKIAKGSRKGADLLMKGSGFAAMDRVGKRGVIRGVLKSAVDDAKAGKLSDNWGFYFDKSELELIAEQLNRHGIDHTKYKGKGAELAEELMFAGLGQQQLISSAGRPAAWARNPNLRPLWALRGFVVKQQALALREVVGNIKAGKPEKAAEFLGRYALYGAGGYAVLNETRQGIFGDGDFSAEGLVRGYGDAWASLLTANTLGLNDYQFGQIKQNGLIPTIIEGMIPIAVDRPLDVGSRVVDFVDRERYATEVIADTLPIVKQSARGVRNVGGMFGLDELVNPAESLLERKPKD